MARCRRVRPRVVMGLLFFPRGGSAQVARALARSLAGLDWDVTLVSSSLAHPDGQGDAHTFYADLAEAGVDLCPVDCTAACDAPDPLRATPPFPPSFEDRVGVPDRVFARLDDATYAHQRAAWTQVLCEVRADEADLLHLHHLTPQYAAASDVAPRVPVVGHLHGTELLMLEAIAAGPPAGWTYAAAWAERLRAWAQSTQLLLVPSPTVLERVQTHMGIPPAAPGTVRNGPGGNRLTHLPNGFDPTRFRSRMLSHAEKAARWRRALVDEPRGWRPGGAPGSVRYTQAQLTPFAEGPVLLYVGRFLGFKRLDVLIRAYERARPDFTTRAPLVLVGGHPGEWEGEHPLTLIERLGAQDVFLAGWHTHDELPQLFAAADVVVLPSVGEQFGLALAEGMACGLSAIAVDAAHGPRELVADGQTGWLVPPADEVGLAAALVQAVNNPAERERRGAAAARAMHAGYAWPAIGERLAGLYLDVLRGSQRPTVSQERL